MRLVLALASLILLWTLPADAKTFRLGNPPVAAITLPDAWEPSETSKGVEATSDDDEIYISVEVASVAKVEDAMVRALAYLVSEGVVIDAATEKQTQGKLGGMDAIFLDYSGKDDAGDPTEISVGVVIVSPTTALIVTYWGSKDGEQIHAKTLEKIADSIRRVD